MAVLPLIGGACQILRACLSGAGSIAERKPAKTEKSRLITNSDGNTDAYSVLHTLVDTDNMNIHFERNTNRNRKLQTCDSGSMRAMLKCGSKLKETNVRNYEN